jgi:hypothetical protein
MANDPASKPVAENGTATAADPKNHAATLAADAKSNGAAAKKNTEDGYCRCLFAYQVLVGYVVEVKVRDQKRIENRIIFFVEYTVIFQTKCAKKKNLIQAFQNPTGQRRCRLFRRIQLPHQHFIDSPNGPSCQRQHW